MKSLDTNILIYAANADSPEHGRAIAVVNDLLERPTEWILADQVLWELYKALRNPKVLSHPRTAAQAAAQVDFLRSHSGVAHCGYDASIYPAVFRRVKHSAFPYQRTHDAILGETLRHHGVRVFYTRNLRDFKDAGFDRLINPIDGA